MKRKLTVVFSIMAIFLVPSLLVAQEVDQSAATTPAVDERPIGGAESIGFSSLPAGFSYTPALRFTQTFQQLSTGSDFDSNTTVGGTLDVSHVRLHDRFVMGYDGGATFSTRQQTGGGSFHNVRVSEAISIRRWTVSVFDSLSYSPESTFGNPSGIAGVGAMTLIPEEGGVDSTLLPAQDILTTDTGRLSNSTAGQVQYRFSYRNSLTAGGSYAVLRFLDRDLQDSNQYAGFASLERMLNPFNTAGLRYSYSHLGYVDRPDTLNTHSVQASFARRITNRLNAHFSIGPEFLSNSPTLATNATALNMGLAGGATYALNRNSLSVLLSRATNAGSGVIAGARTDSITGVISRQLSTKMTAAIQGGYSRNASLNETTGTYIMRSVGMSFTRSLTRTVGAYFSYNGQFQTTASALNTPFLLNGWRHTFGFGLDWHPRGIGQRQ